MKAVITYRHEGKDEYPVMMEMALKSAAHYGYTPAVVCPPDIVGEDQEPHLCEWILQAQEAYLKSDKFSENTIIFSPDTLIRKSLNAVFDLSFDLAVTERDFSKDKINNGVMFIKPENRDKLIALWSDLRRRARNYTDALRRWGADQRALNEAINDNALYGVNLLKLDAGIYNACPKYGDYTPEIVDNAYILHFKGKRKGVMQQYYEHRA